MPSSATRSGYQKPAAGELVNVWGSGAINTNFDLIDDSITGWADIALTASITLTSTNFVANQARLAALHFTGTGAFTVTVPGLSKGYTIWNACTGLLTLFNGTATVTVQPGEVVAVFTDGASVFKRVQGLDFGGQKITGLADPTSPQQAATKAYADALAFTANAGILPGQGVGTVNEVLRSNGTNALWGLVASTELSDYAAFVAAQHAYAIAMALKLRT